MSDVVLGAETGHFLAGEINSVVRDDSMGGSRATYYDLSEKFDNLLPADLEERHYLDPFDEVVGGYQ